MGMSNVTPSNGPAPSCCQKCTTWCDDSPSCLASCCYCMKMIVTCPCRQSGLCKEERDSYPRNNANGPTRQRMYPNGQVKEVQNEPARPIHELKRRRLSYRSWQLA